MGDRATLAAKAKKELEELYLGVPDESVNLTFQDLADVRKHNNNNNNNNNTAAAAMTTSASAPIMEAISERSDKYNSHKPGVAKSPSSPLAKLPSLDFSKGLEASFQSTMPHNNFHKGGSGSGTHHHYQQHQFSPGEGGMWGPYGRDDHYQYPHHHVGSFHNKNVAVGDQYTDASSFRHDDMSMASAAYGLERGGRRRPGIPHSNICTVCCNYIYICRHRCLVCGRVYCRQCVSIGMGEMTEGRKCIDCLGRRFSQRYIKKAGSVGCCMGFSSKVKQQELKWAEKGPRRSGENKYNIHSVMMSRTRSPVNAPSSPSPMHSVSNPPSFVLNAPYSPYSPRNHHPMPF